MSAIISSSRMFAQRFQSSGRISPRSRRSAAFLRCETSVSSSTTPSWPPLRVTSPSTADRGFSADSCVVVYLGRLGDRAVVADHGVFRDCDVDLDVAVATGRRVVPIAVSSPILVSSPDCHASADPAPRLERAVLADLRVVVDLCVPLDPAGAADLGSVCDFDVSLDSCGRIDRGAGVDQMLAVLLCASLHELLSSCFACFGLLFVGGVPVPVLLSSRSVLSVALRPHACMLADVGAPCRRFRPAGPGHVCFPVMTRSMRKFQRMLRSLHRLARTARWRRPNSG